jgi:hypothetical protein
MSRPHPSRNGAEKAISARNDIRELGAAGIDGV